MISTFAFSSQTRNVEKEEEAFISLVSPVKDCSPEYSPLHKLTVKAFLILGVIEQKEQEQLLPGFCTLGRKGAGEDEWAQNNERMEGTKNQYESILPSMVLFHVL